MKWRSETIRFIDRRYLGVITMRHAAGEHIFYASLMRKTLLEEDEAYIRPWWRPHTLSEALTDSLEHARQVILSVYEALSGRLAPGT